MAASLQFLGQCCSASLKPEPASTQHPRHGKQLNSSHPTHPVSSMQFSCSHRSSHNKMCVLRGLVACHMLPSIAAASHCTSISKADSEQEALQGMQRCS